MQSLFESIGRFVQSYGVVEPHGIQIYLAVAGHKPGGKIGIKLPDGKLGTYRAVKKELRQLGLSGRLE